MLLEGIAQKVPASDSRVVQESGLCGNATTGEASEYGFLYNRLSSLKSFQRLLLPPFGVEGKGMVLFTAMPDR